MVQDYADKYKINKFTHQAIHSIFIVLPDAIPSVLEDNCSTILSLYMLSLKEQKVKHRIKNNLHVDSSRLKVQFCTPSVWITEEKELPCSYAAVHLNKRRWHVAQLCQIGNEPSDVCFHFLQTELKACDMILTSKV
jgi:hypothetical protein